MLQPLSSLPESELALQKCCVQIGFGIGKPALSCPHLLLHGSGAVSLILRTSWVGALRAPLGGWKRSGAPLPGAGR